MHLHERTAFIGRYTLSDLFDRTFKMMSRTGRTSLIYSLSLYVPLAVLFAISISRLFATISDLAHLHLADESARALILHFAPATVWILILSLLGWAGQTFVNLAVTHHVATVASGSAPPPATYALLVWKRSFRKVLVQQLITTAAIIVVVIAGGIVGLVGVLLCLLSKDSGTLIAVVLVVDYFATIAGIGILSTYLIFSTQLVVFDHETAVGGLLHSGRIVRGSFWRVLGITLLISLMFSFSINLITTPVVTVSFLPSLSGLIQLAGGDSDATAAYAILDSLRGLGTGIAIAIVIQGVASSFFLPVFFALFCVDLKARKGEFPQPPQPLADSPGAGADGI